MSESKICLSCNEKNHPQLNKCWKCGYVFDAAALAAESQKPKNENNCLKKTIAIIVIIVVATLILIFMGAHYFQIVNEGAFFLKSLFLGLPLAVASIILFLKKIDNEISAKAKGWAVFCLLVFIPALTFEGGKVMNGLFAVGEAQVYSVLALETKEYRGSSGSTARGGRTGLQLKDLYVQSWHDPDAIIKLPGSGFSVIPRQTKIKVVTKRGFLGAEWIKSYGIERNQS